MRFSGLHACLLARSWTSHCLHCMQFSAESGKPGALVTPPGCCARLRSPGSAPLPRPAPPPARSVWFVPSGREVLTECTSDAPQ